MNLKPPTQQINLLNRVQTPSSAKASVGDTFANSCSGLFNHPGSQWNGKSTKMSTLNFVENRILLFGKLIFCRRTLIFVEQHQHCFCRKINMFDLFGLPQRNQYCFQLQCNLQKLSSKCFKIKALYNFRQSLAGALHNCDKASLQIVMVG